MARDGRPRSPHGGVIISHTYKRSFSFIASTFVISCTISHSPSGDSSPLSRSHHVSAILGLTRGYDWNSPPTFGRQEFPFSFLFVMRPIQAFAQLFYDTTTVQHVSFLFCLPFSGVLGWFLFLLILRIPPPFGLRLKKEKAGLERYHLLLRFSTYTHQGVFLFCCFFLNRIPPLCLAILAF